MAWRWRESKTRRQAAIPGNPPQLARWTPKFSTEISATAANLLENGRYFIL
jgi:hypothetical protein